MPCWVRFCALPAYCQPNGIKSYSSKAVRNLGVVMDNHLSMRNQVNTMCSKASFALRRISKVRRFLSRSSTEILVHAFISSILDNYNSLLIGIQDKDIAKLQRIQNSAARLVSLCKKYEHITPILTLFPLGYFEDLSPLGGGADLAPPQISATNGPIDSKIGTVVKQVK